MADIKACLIDETYERRCNKSKVIIILPSTSLRRLDFPMPIIRILSAVEQVADRLRDEMLSGRGKEFLPGVDALAEELAVSRKTVDAALRQLEREGWLIGQGPRRKRRIELQADLNPHALRVAILADETATRRPRYVVEAMHELLNAGHMASFAPGNLSELGNNPKRILRMVEKNPADA